MAKRKTAAKKTTKKPATKKAPTRAASSRKKTSSKKAPVKKKPATKKKPTAKKPATKKKTTKASASSAGKKTTKKVAKKPAPKKKATSKKAPAKKTAKTTAKKPASKKPASKKKTTKKAGSAARPSTKKKKPSAPADDATLKAARAAALRLASLAGLPAVTTNQFAEPEAEKKKRRLTKSPLSASALNVFRDLLLQKRREVAGDVSAIEGEALNPSRAGSLSSLPQHMADQGSDEFEQTLSLGIAASQRRLLVEIEAALDRIDDGVYGICEMTGGAIQKARLEATPWCRYSLEGARMADRGLTPS